MTKKAKQSFAVSNSSNQNPTSDFDINPNFNYDSFKRQAIAKLYAGKGFSGKDGVFSGMIKDILETALGEELSHHLEQEKSDKKQVGDEFDNRRNGYNSKVLKTKESAFELDVARDRNGTFEPQIVKKGQTFLTEELDDKIIALYGLGMSYRDIVAHMEEMYGIEISKSLITSITDKIIPRIKEWQNRPLESVYPIIFLDAIHFKCTEENRVISKAFYSVLGINCEGRKDVLGLYISENEGANFWLSVLTDLHNRGVQDILICCVDGLKGLPEAIAAIFPKTEVQLCVIPSNQE
jgi:transposase-like protein